MQGPALPRLQEVFFSLDHPVLCGPGDLSGNAGLFYEFSFALFFNVLLALSMERQAVAQDCATFLYTLTHLLLLSMCPYIPYFLTQMRYHLGMKKILFLIAGTTLPANLALAAGTLVTYLELVTYFIDRIVIPLLFAVALLVFLVNTVRYFVIGATETEARSKARSHALWSIAAFVFLVGLIGIISLITNSLNWGGDDAICPDYLQDTCGANKDPGDTGSQPLNVGSYEGYSGDGGSSDDSSSTSGTSGESETDTTTSDGNLHELIFGSGADSASYKLNSSDPAKTYNTVSISETASCSDGMSALKAAANSESSQGAYLLYKQEGVTMWENITDDNSSTGITYDEDTASNIIAAGATDAYFVHTHPEKRIDSLDLDMSGHGPSAADMEGICSFGINVGLLTVDWNGVWTVTKSDDACPYSNEDTSSFYLVDTYLALAMVDQYDRAEELTAYTEASIVPSTYKDHFSNQDFTQYENMSQSEIISLSNSYQTYTGTYVSGPDTTSSFCSSY